MGRFFFWLLLVAAAFWFIRKNRQTSKNPSPSEPSSPRELDMVRCQYCGVFISLMDVGDASQEHYCCTSPACLAKKASR